MQVFPVWRVRTIQRLGQLGKCVGPGARQGEVKSSSVTSNKLFSLLEPHFCHLNKASCSEDYREAEMRHCIESLEHGNRCLRRPQSSATIIITTATTTPFMMIT